MDLSPYLHAVRTELAAVAAAAGPETRELAERLAAPLESAMRLALLDALSAAAAEITRDLAPGSVDVRLRGREPQFAVVLPAPEGDEWPDVASRPETAPGRSRPSPDGDDATMVRINLRLGLELKERVEEAAREAGVSVNSWLVRSVTTAFDAPPDRRAVRRAPSGGDRYTGWVG